MEKLYIFDLDGTIADLDHRLHHIDKKPRDWDSFNKACVNDKPKKWIIEMMKSFWSEGTILILSGRNDCVLRETKRWLVEHGVLFDDLIMRKKEDYTSDEILKLEMLNDYLERFPSLEVQFIVEDRQRVVNMWRKNGFNCLQCEAWEEMNVTQ